MFGDFIQFAIVALGFWFGELAFGVSKEKARLGAIDEAPVLARFAGIRYQLKLVIVNNC